VVGRSQTRGQKKGSGSAPRRSPPLCPDRRQANIMYTEKAAPGKTTGTVNHTRNIPHFERPGQFCARSPARGPETVQPPPHDRTPTAAAPPREKEDD